MAEGRGPAKPSMGTTVYNRVKFLIILAYIIEETNEPMLKILMIFRRKHEK